MFTCHGDTNVVLISLSDTSAVAACPPEFPSVQCHTDAALPLPDKS